MPSVVSAGHGDEELPDLPGDQATQITYYPPTSRRRLISKHGHSMVATGEHWRRTFKQAEAAVAVVDVTRRWQAVRKRTTQQVAWLCDLYQGGEPPTRR